jgi:hypothetical protein
MLEVTQKSKVATKKYFFVAGQSCKGAKVW